MNRIVLFLLLLFSFNIHAETDLDSLRSAGGACLRATDHAAALRVFTLGVEESKQQNDPHSEALFLIDMGYVYQLEGDLQKALELYEKGRAIAEKNHFWDIEGSGYRNMATIRIKKGEYEKASQYLAEAAARFESTDNKDELSSTLNTMGTIQFQLGNYGQALLFYKKALPLFEQLKKGSFLPDEHANIDLDIAIVLNNIGEAYKETGQYASAAFYLKRSLALKKRLGLLSHEANTLNVMGEVSQAMKNYPEALRYYNSAYAIRKEKRDDAALANSANSLASLYADTREYRLAEKFLLIARGICERDSLRGELLKNYQLSRRVYRQLGETTRALLFDDRYIALFEQMKKEEQIKLIHDLNIKYQTEQKDKEFHLLEQDKELLLELDKSRLLFIYGIIAFSVIIISVILLAYYQKRKSNAKIELMMRELNHRAKNNFQQLSGLLLLYHNQLKDPVAKKAIKETANRVQAMSVVHRKLYLSEDTTLVAIDIFIKELSEELLLSYGYTKDTLRLNLSLESISMAADKAVPLSLIINELLTNAFKYAFDSNPDPVLDLTLTRQDKKIVLTVQDNGAGIADHNISGDSFGLRLIRMLCRQINAELVISNNNGTGVKIIMPQAP